MKKLIISLVRRYLGLKKYEGFKFVNQKSDDIYYFGDDGVYKAYSYGPDYGGSIKKSNVSLNWLLDDECDIQSVGMLNIRNEYTV